MPLTESELVAFERTIMEHRRDRLKILEERLGNALVQIPDNPFEIVPLARISHLARRLTCFEGASGSLLVNARHLRSRYRKLRVAYVRARKALRRFAVDEALRLLDSDLKKLPRIARAITRIRPLAVPLTLLHRVGEQVPGLIARGAARRLEQALACMERHVPRPVIADIRERIAIERERLTSLAGIESAALEDRPADAIALARQHLERFGKDDAVRWNLERHLVPRLAHWQAMESPVDERRTRALERMRDRPDGASLQAWFATEITAARAGHLSLPDLMTAWSMVVANQEVVVQASDRPYHMARKMVADLRDQLEGLFREAADRLPDFNRADALALELGKGHHGWFRDSIVVLPSALAAMATAGCTWRPPDDPDIARLLEVLHGPWAGVGVAMHLGDITRARAVLPGKASTKAERFFARDVRIRALVADWAELGLGDDWCDHGAWKRNARAIRSRREWTELVDACFQQAFEAIRDDLPRLERMADFWYSVTRSSPARKACLEVQARMIGRTLDDGRLTAREALDQLDGLLAEDPEHGFVRAYHDIVMHLRDLKAVLEGLQTGDTTAAIALAMTSPYPVRERTARALTLRAVQALEERDLPPVGARNMVVAAREICPDSPDLLADYVAFGV